MSDSRVCIVGAGKHSTKRIYPYIGAAGAQLVGICVRTNQKKAERNARRFGGRVYTDLEKMLNIEKPNGVIICIGPDQHAVLASVIMRRGIPVYTEKPPASSAKKALEIARISKETGVLCTIAFKKRYNIAYTRAREWIDSLREDPISISVDYASGHYANDTPRNSFLLDFAIHIIDLVGYLFGDVERVFCFRKNLDAYAVSLKFRNGAVGTLNLNDERSFRVPTEEVEISMAGGNFVTIHNSSCWRISQNGKPVEWREPPTFVSAGDSGNDTGHFAEVIDFFQAIKEKRTTRSNIYESYKSFVLYEAIKESSESGKVVDVKYEQI